MVLKRKMMACKGNLQLNMRSTPHWGPSILFIFKVSILSEAREVEVMQIYLHWISRSQT